jgi:ABC-type antimicrobial peptide transport system permease subunit
VGIVAGLAISAVAVAALKWPYDPQVITVAGAFAFSALVGIFFGLNPATRAAKLDPVAALGAE